METDELIERFATIAGISQQEANQAIGANSVDEILENIKNYHLEKIYKNLQPTNREQRRKFNKKYKKQAKTIADTATKLQYIELIQKLRELNKKNEESSKED